MDAESVEDIIDFWNLRATGRPVLPLPKQFNSTPQFEKLITDYLKEHRVHWRHDPKVCEMAHFIRSRNSTMDEMQAYAKTLTLEIPKGDTSTDGFYALQHWYPRFWDEWARDKDDVVPRDTYAEPDASIDVEDPKELSVRFKPLSHCLRTSTAFTVRDVAPMRSNSGSTAPASTLQKSFLRRPAPTSNALFRDLARGRIGVGRTGSSRLSPMT